MDTIIKTTGISKIYNPGMPDEMRALSDINIEIGREEIALLKGPSGSGKTTLLSLIGCMSRPSEGSIFINGKDVAGLPERFLAEIRRKTFGFIFQHFNLIRGLSALENIMLPLYPTNIKISEIRERTETIIMDFGLLDKKKTLVERLSGGEQQRTAIARALIGNPDIILADEPTAHLDTKLSEELLEILFALNKKGKTIIIATHDPFVYGRDMIGRIIEMRDGTIQEVTGSS